MLEGNCQAAESNPDEVQFGNPTFIYGFLHLQSAFANWGTHLQVVLQLHAPRNTSTSTFDIFSVCYKQFNYQLWVCTDGHSFRLVIHVGHVVRTVDTGHAVTFYYCSVQITPTIPQGYKSFFSLSRDRLMLNYLSDYFKSNLLQNNCKS